jgi:hypothetical protein
MMLIRIVRAGLAAATLIAAAALVPTAATAGGSHGGIGSGNWPQSGTWNWPEGAGPGCTWQQVRHTSHGKTYTHWARLCP